MISRLLSPRLLVWLAPVAVFGLLYKESAHEKLFFEVLLAIGLLVLVARHPFRALTVLVVVLPFNTLLLSALFRYHVPASAVRGLGFWKEGVVVGLAVAAIINVRNNRAEHCFDLLDRLAAGYVVLGLAFLVTQPLLDANGPGGHFTLYVRELGWRGDVLYIGIFLIGRHLGLDAAQVERIVGAILVTILVVAAIGVYEFFRPYSFNHFVTVTLQLGRYQAQVLHAPLGNPTSILAFANGTSRVRIGSVLINNLLDGWYYVFGLALTLDRLVRRRRSPFGLLCLPVIVAALVFTQARASIIAGGVAAVAVLRPARGRPSARRVQLASVLALGLLIAVPVVVISGLGHRFTSSVSSDKGHTSRAQEGIQIMFAHPVGQGLATGVAGGQIAAGKGLTGGSTIFDPEDQWLEIGMQLGFLGLFLWASVVLRIIRQLRPRGPTADRLAPSALGVRAALMGLLVGGFVAQVFIEPVVSWTVFFACGLAASRIDSSGDTGQYYPGTTAGDLNGWRRVPAGAGA